MRSLQGMPTNKTMLKRLSIPRMTQAMADPYTNIPPSGWKSTKCRQDKLTHGFKPEVHLTIMAGIESLSPVVIFLDAPSVLLLVGIEQPP